MSPSLLLIVSTLAGLGAVLWLFGTRIAFVPSLDRTLRRMQRDSVRASDMAASEVHEGSAGLPHLKRQLITHDRWGLIPPGADLRIIGMAPMDFAGRLLLAAVFGFLAPMIGWVLLRVSGLVGLHMVLPIGVSVLGLVVVPLIWRSHIAERVQQARTDVRHQASAYLDVVTMLLAGNTAHEGALRYAADAGDGQLFTILRRRMREVTTSGVGSVDALAGVAEELGIVELRQVASTARLSAAEGAPVARSISAKCSTLRSTLAAEQESEARLRTSRLTGPLVGMALIFMALVVYPALQLT